MFILQKNCSAFIVVMHLKKYILFIKGKSRISLYMRNKQFYYWIQEKYTVTIWDAAIKLFRNALILLYLTERKRNVLLKTY